MAPVRGEAGKAWHGRVKEEIVSNATKNRKNPGFSLIALWLHSIISP